MIVEIRNDKEKKKVLVVVYLPYEDKTYKRLYECLNIWIDEDLYGYGDFADEPDFDEMILEVARFSRIGDTCGISTRIIEVVADEED